MRTPKRCPVMYEEYLMNSIGICWPFINNKNTRFQMNILAELLQEEINKKLGRKIKRKEKIIKEESSEQGDVRKFIATFRDRYAYETDMEYKSKISPEEIGMMKAMVKKLRDKEVDIEEYMDWIFDDFFEDEKNRNKFVPSIKLVTGTFLASKFFMQNRDRLRRRKVAVESKSRRDAVRNHGKILFRKTKEEKIQIWLRWEKEKTITTEDLEDYLKKYEEEIGALENE